MNATVGARRVLVPVANPASAPPLVHWASLLAGAGGSVKLLTVVSESATSDDYARAWRGLSEAEDSDPGSAVSVTGQVVASDDTAAEVLAAIGAEKPDLVVMGWRGITSSTDVFGRLIDHIIGRSRVPLGIIRLGLKPTQRILFPVSDEHLLPGGGGGLSLAASLVDRLRTSTGHPATILRSGSRQRPLPAPIAALGDRIHHDPRQSFRAVGAFARPSDVIVAAVAPTASGLRAATTHLAWAAPDATLIVALDVGPVGDGVIEAASAAGTVPPARHRSPLASQRIVVTIRVAEDQAVTAGMIETILRSVGTTDQIMSWWPADDERPHIGATVTVLADSANHALGAVMSVMHDAPELHGSEISYEIDRGAPGSLEARARRTASTRQ